MEFSWGEFLFKEEVVAAKRALFPLEQCPQSLVQMFPSCGLTNSSEKVIEDVGFLFATCYLLSFMNKRFQVLFLPGSF